MNNKISKEEFIKTKKLIKQLWDEEVDDVIDTIVNNGNEHWYPVDDSEDNKYSFSNLGRVRNDRTGHILKDSGMWFEDWDGDLCMFYGLSKNGKKINFYVKDPFTGAYNDYNLPIILYVGKITHWGEGEVFKNVYEASEYTNVPIDDILDNCHYYKGKSKLFNKDGIPLIFSFG